MKVRLVVLSVVAFLVAATALPYGAGGSLVTNRTLKPGSIVASCGGCHATGSGITVALSGPASLYPGQLGTFTITMTKSGAEGQKVGIDVAASDNTLSTFGGEPTVLVNNEIAHSGTLRTLSSGTAFYKFNWTMPPAAALASTHTIYGVSAHGPSTGGGWAHASSKTVTAVAPPNPASITVGTITSSSIVVNWNGTSSEFRVLRKTGSAPATPTDGTVVYDGALKTSTAGSLAASTKYFFAVYGKVAGALVFSTGSLTTSATTLAPAPAGTLYVNASTGNDVNPGTLASPFKTITHALGVASSGNIIIVAAGTYNTALGEVFPIIMKSGVQLKSAGGAKATIIDATAASPRTRVMHAIANIGGTLVEGFTIKGGLLTSLDGAQAQGGGIFTDSNDATTFSRNIISGNEAHGFNGTASNYYGGGAFGGGGYVNSGSTTFVNNVFSNNIARGGTGYSIFGTPSTTGGSGGYGEGGGVYAPGGTVVFMNNTFVGNQAIGGNGGFGDFGGNGGGSNAAAASIYTGTIVNNIFANSTAVGGTKGAGSTTDGSNGTAGVGGLGGCCATTTNNLFFGNIDDGTNTGTAAIIGQNPLFVSVSDFHVGTSSSAKAHGTATGAPAIDIEGTARPNPPTIGAYEAAVPAAIGDANGDQQITPADVVFLINFLMGGGSPPVGSGDVNGDAAVNALDVFYLVNYLFSGGPAPV